MSNESNENQRLTDENRRLIESNENLINENLRLKKENDILHKRLLPHNDELVLYNPNHNQHHNRNNESPAKHLFPIKACDLNFLLISDSVKIRL